MRKLKKTIAFEHKMINTIAKAKRKNNQRASSFDKHNIEAIY